MPSSGRMRGLFQCLLTAEQIWCPAVGIYLGTSSPEQGDGEAGTQGRGTQGVPAPQAISWICREFISWRKPLAFISKVT